MNPPIEHAPVALMERITQKLQAEQDEITESPPGQRPEDMYKIVVRFDGVGGYLDTRRPEEPLHYTQSGLVVGTKLHDTGALTVSVGAPHLKHGVATNKPILADITALFGGFMDVARDNGLPTYFVHEGRDIVLPPNVDKETALQYPGRSPENLQAAWLAHNAGVKQKSWEPDMDGTIMSLRHQGFSDDDIMAYLGGRQLRQAVSTEYPAAYMQQHVIDRYAALFPAKKYTYEEMLRVYASRSHDHVRPLEYMARFATLLTALDNPYAHLSKNVIVSVARAYNLERHEHHLSFLQSEGSQANLFDLSGTLHTHRLDHDKHFDMPPFAPAVSHALGSISLSSCLREHA